MFNVDPKTKLYLNQLHNIKDINAYGIAET
jgi:hypothetical protein